MQTTNNKLVFDEVFLFFVPFMELLAHGFEIGEDDGGEVEGENLGNDQSADDNHSEGAAGLRKSLQGRGAAASGTCAGHRQERHVFDAPAGRGVTKPSLDAAVVLGAPWAAESEAPEGPEELAYCAPGGRRPRLRILPSSVVRFRPSRRAAWFLFQCVRSRACRMRSTSIWSIT